MSTIINNSIVGSSYQLTGARNIDDEFTLNMYEEALGTNSKGSITTYLKSIAGTRDIYDTDFSLKIGCRGLYGTTRSYQSDGYDGLGNLYFVFGNNLYYADRGLTSDISANSSHVTLIDDKLQTNTNPVAFAESGGINPELLIAQGTTYLAVVPEKDQYKTIKSITNPTNPYTADDDNPDGKVVTSDCIVNMGNRVICNDRGTGQIFISRAGAFQGGKYKNVIYALDSDKKIIYASDGYTPTYNNGTDGNGVDADAYAWKNDYGEYQYETALQTTGDAIISMKAINDNRLWVFGTRSFDVWELSSDSDDGYSISRTGMGTNIGCAATNSVAYVNNQLSWLGAGADGHSGIYSSMNGQFPVKISTPALDQKISTLSNIADARGFGYINGGHIFYVLSFASDNFTIVYDFSTGKWHNRSTHNDLQDIDEVWWPMYATEFNSKVYFGTVLSNSLVQLDESKYDEYDGRHIKRLRRTPPIISDFSPVSLQEFKIVTSSGMTNVLQPLTNGHVTEGYSPNVMLRYSHDGSTYSSYIYGNAGLAGNYNTEVKWCRLGTGRYFVIEVSMTDPAPFFIGSSKVRYEVLDRF